MTVEEQIRRLRDMQSQIIHGTSFFGEVANQLEQLTAERDSLLRDSIKITATELMDKMTAVEGDWEKIRSTTALRVKFVNNLRELVGATKPRNKAGAPLVSDFDLIDAPMSMRVKAIDAAMSAEKGEAQHALDAIKGACATDESQHRMLPNPGAPAEPRSATPARSASSKASKPTG